MKIVQYIHQECLSSYNVDQLDDDFAKNQGFGSLKDLQLAYTIRKDDGQFLNATEYGNLIALYKNIKYESFPLGQLINNRKACQMIQGVVIENQESLNKKLLQAVTLNKIDEVKNLLDQGADVDAEDEFGSFPLNIAIIALNVDIERNKSLKLVELLFQYGANVHKYRLYVDSPFLKIIKSKDEELLNLFKQYYVCYDSPVLGQIINHHIFIINLNNSLGYRRSDRGTCAGIACLAIQYYLAGNIDVFKKKLERIRLLTNANINELAIPDYPMDHAIKVDETTEITRLDIMSFLDAINVYQHIVFYNKEFGIDDYGLYEVLNPVQLEDSSDYVAEVESFIGEYSLESMGAFFNVLADNVRESFSLLLSAARHAISINFDSKTKVWTFVDANQLPPCDIKHEKVGDLIDWVWNKSFSFPEGANLRLYEIRVLGLQSNIKKN